MIHCAEPDDPGLQHTSPNSSRSKTTVESNSTLFEKVANHVAHQCHIDIVIISDACTESLKKLTEKALETLFVSESDSDNVVFHAIVVESSPGNTYTLPAAVDRHSIQTIHPKQSYGYHCYLNLGRKAGKSEYVALCNNDLVFEKGWASAILKVMTKYSEMLSASPWCPSILGPNILRADKVFFGYRIRHELAGWCIFQRRTIYDRIGDMDERFKHWYCDNDYAMQLQANGIIHGLVANSVVEHHRERHGETFQNRLLRTSEKVFTDNAAEVFRKKWPEAPQAVEECWNCEPSDDLRQAQARASRGEYSDAIMELEEAIGKTLEIPPWSLFILAKCYVETGNYYRAELLSESLKLRFPRRALGYMIEAMLSMKHNNLKTALGQWHHSLKMNPGSWIPLAGLINTLLSLQFVDEAEALSKSFMDDHSNPAGITTFADYLISNKQFDRAVQILSRLGNDSLAGFGKERRLANCYQNLGYLSKAIDLLERIVEKNPDELWIRKRIVNLTAEDGDYEGVIERCRELTEYSGNDPEVLKYAFCKLSESFRILGRAVDAEQACDQVMMQFPKYPHGLAAKIKLLTSIGRRRDAVEYVRKCENLGGRDTGVNEMLALFWHDAGNSEHAEHIVRSPFEENPDIKPFGTLVNYLSLSGGWSKILELGEAYPEMFSQIRRLRFIQGTAYLQSRLLKSARKIFSEIIESKDTSFNGLVYRLRSMRFIRQLNCREFGNGHVQESLENVTETEADIPGLVLFSDKSRNALVEYIQWGIEPQEGCSLEQVQQTGPVYDVLNILADVRKHLDSVEKHFGRCFLNTDCDLNEAHELLSIVIDRIERKKPFSLIRLGDGEGSFLDYPESQCVWQARDQEENWRIWWGTDRLTTESALELSELLKRSIKDSDCIGIPPMDRFLWTMRPMLLSGTPDRQWRKLLPILDWTANSGNLKTNGCPKLLASCNIHTDWGLWELYPKLFQYIKSCSVITCHGNMEEVLRDKFGVARVRVIKVPPENFWSSCTENKGLKGERHYPDRYEQIVSKLEVLPGEVFLVGAGILGKAYCALIRRRGGIALDLGSVMDYWLGHLTRSEHRMMCFSSTSRNHDN